MCHSLATIAIMFVNHITLYLEVAVILIEGRFWLLKAKMVLVAECNGLNRPCNEQKASYLRSRIILSMWPGPPDLQSIQ